MRTKGSNATTKITIGALLDQAPKGRDQVIEVRRKWLEGLESALGIKFEISGGDAPKLVETTLPETKQINTEVKEINAAVPRAENTLIEEEL